MSGPITIEVCVQKRYGPNPECCANKNSQQILSELKIFFKKQGLINISVNPSQCLLHCENGPNLKLSINSKIYHHVTVETFNEILTICKSHAK